MQYRLVVGWWVLVVKFRDGRLTEEERRRLGAGPGRAAARQELLVRGTDGPARTEDRTQASQHRSR